MRNINPHSESLRALLKRQEGLSLKPYKDSLGFLTIGYGHNLVDISLDIANDLLTEDLKEAIVIAKHVLTPSLFQQLNQSQQLAIISMAFQLGETKMLKFKRFRSYMLKADIEGAIPEMRNSLWYKQTPKRVEELIELLKKEE